MKDYQLDGNKEMVALGTMNMLGSMTSCYVTTGTNGVGGGTEQESSSQGSSGVLVCRFLFAVRGELYGRVPNHGVERGHVAGSDADIAGAHTPLRVHPERHPFFHHHLGCPGTDRLRSSLPHLEG